MPFSAEYYAANREKILAQQRHYQQTHKAERRAHIAANKDRINARRRKWTAEHPELIKAANQRSYIRHKEKRNEASRAEYRKKREHYLALARRWHEAHPEKAREAKRKWKRENPEIDLLHANKRRARIAAVTYDDSARAFYIFHKTAPLVECVYCGEMIAGKVCHIDHIIPISRGGPHIASNLAVACPTCNQKKGSRLNFEPIRKMLNERQDN